MYFNPKEMNYPVEEYRLSDPCYYEMSIKILNWHRHFLKMARLVAERSKDRSTQCGCVIVKNNRVLATGYNGFPRGTEDYDNDKKHERPEKYLWFEHSERNAIYNAAAHGVALDGSTAYVTGPPCVDCTRAMIQSGIDLVVIPKQHNMQGRPVTQQWKDQAKVAEAMMANARVVYVCLEIDDERHE